MTKRKKAAQKVKVKDDSAAADRRFIEIVNWKIAQCISTNNAPWMKLYTSLLDNDAFGNLDDESRMLIISLWLYTARVGHHVFLADPRWLRRKIPMLNTDPNLDPLLEATDDRGCPTPFLRYCGPPTGQEKATKKQEKRATKKQGKKSTKKQEKKSTKKESRGVETAFLGAQTQLNRYCGPPETDQPSRAGAHAREKRRGEESRGEQTRDGREEKKREKKRRAEERRAEQSRAETGDKTASQSTVDQKTSEPADPPKPDQGQAQAAYAVQPAPGLSNQPRPDRRRRSLSSAVKYDRHDLTVGRRVHQALRLLSDPDEGDGYSEVCSFASVLHGILEQHSRSPPEARDHLVLRIIKLAVKIAKSKSARSKSAIWISKAREIAASDKWA